MNDSSDGRPVLPSGASAMVVGGTGFIGSHLSARLQALGLRVTRVGTTGGQGGGGDVVTIDAREASEVERMFRSVEPPTYLFNLAGFIDHRSWRDGGRDVFRQHADSAVNLVSSAWTDHLRAFVQVGSSDEYGPAPAPQSESLHAEPISPYSTGKAAASLLVSSLGRNEGFPGIVARLFLVYGPGQSPDRFLPQVITACLRDERVATTPGEQLRDFSYVSDIIDGLIAAALACERVPGEVVNLASGSPVSIRQVMETVVELIGRGQLAIGARPYRDGENMELFADVEKAARLLGWRARTSLRDGLAQTVDAYRRTIDPPLTETEPS